MSIFNQLEIHYINLEHRRDRKKEIEFELDRLEISNFNRFEGIRKNPGILGCSLSHLKIYEQSSRLKPLMVIEDDCQFLLEKSEIEDLINLFLKSKADVFCLAFNIAESSFKSFLRRIRYNLLRPNLWPLIFGKLKRGAKIQTMSCYILKPHMIEILINLSEKCVEDLANGKPAHESAIDQAWKKLQKKHVFVIPHLRAAKQRGSFSDIELAHKDYGV